MRWRRRLLWIGVIALLIALLSVWYDRHFTIDYVAARDVRVRLTSVTGHKLTEVGFFTYNSRFWADDKDHLKLADESYYKAPRFDGNELRVNMPTFGMESGFGRDLGHTKPRVLILKLQYQDAQTEYKVIEFPNGYQDVTLEIP